MGAGCAIAPAERQAKAAPSSAFGSRMPMLPEAFRRYYAANCGCQVGSWPAQLGLLPAY